MNVPTQNPYAAPGSFPVPDEDEIANPTAAIYPAGHVAIATFFGTPLGGAIVLAMNEKRLGRKKAVVPTVVAGLFAVGALFAISLLAPDGIPTSPLSIVAVFIMRAVAQRRQQGRVDAHLSSGGRRASAWSAVGVGLLTTLVVSVPVVLLLLLFASPDI